MKNKGYAKLGGKYGELREMCKWRIGHLNYTVFLPLGPEFISLLLSYLKPLRILIVIVIKFILSCKWTMDSRTNRDPVGIELFSNVKIVLRSKKLAQLLTR